MKNNIVMKEMARSLLMMWLPVVWLLLMMLTGSASMSAQEDSTSVSMETDTTVVETEEAEELEETTFKSRMSLTADQYPDGTIALNGLLRAKIEGAYQKVPNSKVTFFVVNAEGEETALGDTQTGAGGMAGVKVSKASLVSNEEGFYSFLARFDGSDRFESSESDLSLRPAILTMETNEEDSIFLLKLQASAESPEGLQPIAGALVVVYVERMFSSLKVAEGETDETGAVELDFPSGLPGDGEGKLVITAIIEETEEYGNLTNTVTKPWGYVVSAEHMESPKALWSPHPPTWMVITFFILMGAVWIHYVIVIYNLFRIKADGHHAQGKA